MEDAFEKVSATFCRAVTHIQGKGYEPDLVFAAMINVAVCFAVNSYGYAEAMQMAQEAVGLMRANSRLREMANQ